MTDRVAAIWAAVDEITKPSTRTVARSEVQEWVADLADLEAGACSVAAYRAATKGHGTVPSLWVQAEMALTAGKEAPAGNPSPLAARTPADLDLMEIMLQIREAIGLQFAPKARENVAGREQLRIPSKDVPAQLRRLAAHIIGHEPDHVEWWTFRISQWARALSVYLRAIECGPKPVRLRNAACPLCHTRQMTIESDNGPIVVPPLLIDFQNGAIRAATCEACGATWWRGDQLHELADALDTPTADVAQTG